MEPSADWLEHYLESTDPYDEIYIMLFSHGVDSVGLVPIDRWRAILKRARKRGDFIGVDAQAFPRDFAAFARYHTDIKKKIAARYPMPGPLSLSELDLFLKQTEGRYPVEWLELQQEPIPKGLPKRAA